MKAIFIHNTQRNLNMQTNTQNNQVTKQDVQTEAGIRILKSGTCPSLSESSTLSYYVGCDAESAIHFRVYANSGSGYFSSKEWVSMESIGKALAESKCITSFSLHPVYRGRSLNNGGFLLAALKAEGLVLASVSEDKKSRSYQLGNPEIFLAEVKMLIESSVNIDADSKPTKKAKKSA